MKRIVLSVVGLLLLISLTACGGGGQPKAGATYNGTIDVPKEKASNASLRFKVSDDGTQVTSIGLMLSDLHCETMSAGSMSQNTGGQFPLSGNQINIQSDSIGEIKGSFTSATEASGTIHIAMKNKIMGATMLCDLGTFNWKAKAP
ncbi:MAG: hypothetical protein M1282_06825 [Chloroflexi bacterium]|nr:hypothetical protein [Chloroflexota bacterium]